MAQIALRDTLLAAQGHIARLARPEDPESFGSWLYSLARAECRQHLAAPAAEADRHPGAPAEMMPTPGRWRGARRRAWRRASSRRSSSPAGTTWTPAWSSACPPGRRLALLARARLSLERALGAEILVSRGPACPDLAAVLAGALAGRAGRMTAQIRERVLEHAAVCQACADKRPRNVSAARVFALLPAPALSPLARAEVLEACAGHEQAAAQSRSRSPPFRRLSGCPLRLAGGRAAGGGPARRRRPRRVPGRPADRRGGRDRLGGGDRLGLRPGRAGGPARRGPRGRARRGGRRAGRTRAAGVGSRHRGSGSVVGPARPTPATVRSIPAVMRRRWSARPASWARSRSPPPPIRRLARAPAAQGNAPSQPPGPGATAGRRPRRARCSSRRRASTSAPVRRARSRSPRWAGRSAGRRAVPRRTGSA